MTPAVRFARFDRYEIVRKLGRSMTDVYLAFDPEAQRHVVLKIIEECHDSATALVVDAERRGAMIQQQLHARDGRILEIYEYGEKQGCFFVAMQYVEGRTLAEILQREGRQEPRQAALYAAEILSQLGSLHTFQAEIDGHERAVVHGDIKPANIQVGPQGELWLLDFGIAKAITATRNLTHHDFGSPAYCSPERLRNTQVNPQADLWAVAVCLYELLSGVPPYQARSTRKLEGLIQSRRPPRALPETCPGALRAIVWKALSATISRRYETARSFEKDLRAFLAGDAVAAEREQEPSWEVPATVERDEPPTVRPRLETLVHERFTVNMYATAGLCLAAGLLGAFGFLWATQIHGFWRDSALLRGDPGYERASVGQIEFDWRRYERLAREHPSLMQMGPGANLRNHLRTNLLRTGDSVIDAYRNGAGPGVQGYDWHKARVAFSKVLELDPSSQEVRGKVALCQGYEALTANPPGWPAARVFFQQAAAELPRSPDPHLALARVSLYNSRNLGEAMAEWHAAERLGYRPGPRELQQQADGFMQLAELDLTRYKAAKTPAAQSRLLAQFRRDAERARNLYESIPGYADTGKSLERLDADDGAVEQMRTAREAALRHPRRSSRYSARWQ